MINTNITAFRKDIFNIIEQTIQFNEPVNINTKAGNAVLLSEEDYNSMVETLYLRSIPSVWESIEEGINTPLSECTDLSEVWPDV